MEIQFIALSEAIDTRLNRERKREREMGQDYVRMRVTRRTTKKAGPETARTRTMSPITIVLREPARDGAVRDLRLGGHT